MCLTVVHVTCITLSSMYHTYLSMLAVVDLCHQHVETIEVEIPHTAMLETIILFVNKPVYLGRCHISLDNHVNGQPCAGKYPDQLHGVMDNHRVHPDVADTCFWSWMKPTSKPPWSLWLHWFCAVLDEKHDRCSVSPARDQISWSFWYHILCAIIQYEHILYIYVSYTCIFTCPWLFNKAIYSTSTKNIINQPVLRGRRIWSIWLPCWWMYSRNDKAKLRHQKRSA